MAVFARREPSLGSSLDDFARSDFAPPGCTRPPELPQCKELALYFDDLKSVYPPPEQDEIARVYRGSVGVSMGN